MKPKATWQAHKNSIFDVIWSLDDEQLVSASGDLNAAVWDAESQKLICVFVGHSASIKCISANPRNKCTAVRDFWMRSYPHPHRITLQANMLPARETAQLCSGTRGALGKLTLEVDGIELTPHY